MGQPRAADRGAAFSKAVSYALRHHPEEFGLHLDPEGWVDVDELIAGLRTTPDWADVEVDDLVEMLATSTRRRHQLEGGRIRALYGHSVAEGPALVAAEPPDVLYHGTAAASLPSIRSQGLLPGPRRFVHLSTTFDLAARIGSRKDARTVIVLTVDARAAASAGIVFSRAGDEIFVAERVPARFVGHHETTHPRR
jgi:putative RNA 2'-phosphotransferase